MRHKPAALLQAHGIFCRQCEYGLREAVCFGGVRGRGVRAGCMACVTCRKLFTEKSTGLLGLRNWRAADYQTVLDRQIFCTAFVAAPQGCMCLGM